MAIKERTTKKKPTKRPNAKQSAYNRLSRKIDDAMRDVMSGADKLLDCLPAFKRLNVLQRKRIYDYVDEITENLCSYVDEYEDTLPESEEESDLRGLGAILGMGALLGMAAKRHSQDPAPEESAEWPDSLNVEFREIEPEPKQLIPGKGSES